MSAGTFELTYSAAAQLASLPPTEKAALKRLFSSHEIDQPTTTRPTGDGRFVSRLGSMRVLWRRSASHMKPEIISIVDQSFAQAV